MSYSEFLDKYGIPAPPKEYALVFHAIPSGAILLLRSSAASVRTVLPLDPVLTSVGQTSFSYKSKKVTVTYVLCFKKKLSLFQILSCIGITVTWTWTGRKSGAYPLNT